MRLATWNLERVTPRSHLRLARIHPWFATVDADVWVLTETHDDVAPAPGFAPAASGVPERPGKVGERWAMVWSRFPIEPLPPTSDPGRSVAVLVHPTDGRPLLVYGAVLPWVGSAWNGIPGRDGQAFAAALDAQRSDWLRLAAEHPDADMVVAGDLNQDLADRHYYGSRRGRATLRAALSDVRLRALTGDPSDPVRELAPDRASIDHLCVPEDSARFADAVVDVWPRGPAPDPTLTDHFGVAVTTRS